MNLEQTSAVVVDAAFQLHKNLGPGLLESVYETILARTLEQRGLRVDRQRVLAFEYQGMHFHEGFRIDLLVNSAGVNVPKRSWDDITTEGWDTGDGTFAVQVKNQDGKAVLSHSTATIAAA